MDEERARRVRWLTVLGSLYFSQGLPMGFFTQALPVVLRERGVDLAAVGAVNLLAAPWALKFLWSPWIDAHGSPRFGKRRTFIVPLQFLTVGILGVLALTDPMHSLVWIVVAALAGNLVSATQDIATDGLAVDMLRAHERGIGNGVQVGAHRIGMIVGGGLLLIVYDRIGWSGSFVAMAAMLAAATLPILFHREPPATPSAPRIDLREWFSRPGALAWILLLTGYKAGEGFAHAMLRPFLKDLGFELGRIGAILGVIGWGTGFAGALLGGWLCQRIGRRMALVSAGVLQVVTILLYAAYAWPASPIARNAVWWIAGIEAFTTGMCTAAIFTATMDVTRPERAATDYTVQACALIIGPGIVAATSGLSARTVGYPAHFALAAVLSAAGILYVARYRGTKEFRLS